MGRSRTTHAGCAPTEKQDRFVRLIAQGVSNREACRIIGINRGTGTRWRLGRTIRNTAGEAVHYPQVRILTPPKRHPRYLSLDERMVIADLWRE
jgi:transposase, IS30 family